MKTALFYECIDKSTNTVQCGLCPHHCKIQHGKRGLCKVRENRDGQLISLVYGRLVSENIDPIEKKPLFHVLPGSRTFSISTVGCNFKCRHCQNYQISQYPLLHPGEIPGKRRTPAEIVKLSLQHNCQSISYTYVEPTIFFEFAYETAQLAKESGLLNIFVSNGYTSPEATRTIAPYLDANNIDLKSFSDAFYRDICGARLQPVLDTITLMKELGVFVEVTTLVIPGLNDSPEELQQIAHFLVSIDSGIPWHVSRFHPTYRLTDRPPTEISTLLRAREIGLSAGLRHVYTGNIPGEDGESTVCPNCGIYLIERVGYTIVGNKLHKNQCPSCGTPIAGIFT